MTITIDQVRDTAAKVVQRFGEDHKNPKGYDGPVVDDADNMCVYTDPHGNHCIAGQVLVDLGQPVPEWGDTNNSIFAFELLSYGYDIEDQAIQFLTTMQSIADEDGRWGAALASANASYERGDL